jgi:hypothetical protein
MGILACLCIAGAVLVRMSMDRVRAEIVQACEPKNPAIEAVAAVIRREGRTPIEEVALVSLAADHLLDYDRSLEVYGPGVPTVSEILARRRTAHWLYPRGDCKENAVLAGSLLSALNIRWEPELSLPLGHAWIRVHLPCGSWDIMAIPARNIPGLGSSGTKLVAFLAGGSATPLAAPQSRFTQPAADWLANRGFGQAYLPLNDVAALGLVIVTPHSVRGHAPIDFVSLGEPARIDRAAWSSARFAGFPLGEPL